MAPHYLLASNKSQSLSANNQRDKIIRHPSHDKINWPWNEMSLRTLVAGWTWKLVLADVCYFPLFPNALIVNTNIKTNGEQFLLEIKIKMDLRLQILNCILRVRKWFLCALYYFIDKGALRLYHLIQPERKAAVESGSRDMERPKEKVYIKLNATFVSTS